jgi:hypothetical protein
MLLCFRLLRNRRTKGGDQCLERSCTWHIGSDQAILNLAYQNDIVNPCTPNAVLLFAAYLYKTLSELPPAIRPSFFCSLPRPIDTCPPSHA